MVAGTCSRCSPGGCLAVDPQHSAPTRWLAIQWRKTELNRHPSATKPAPRPPAMAAFVFSGARSRSSGRLRVSAARGQDRGFAPAPTNTKSQDIDPWGFLACDSAFYAFSPVRFGGGNPRAEPDRAVALHRLQLLPAGAAALGQRALVHALALLRRSIKVMGSAGEGRKP